MISNVSGLYPEAGLDEAGRGCLAGPVVAAAVILPQNYKLKGLNDSKLLSQTKREQLRKMIEAEALAWAVGTASVVEIDQINILQATFLAMHRAIEKLSLNPSFLLIDGNRFKPYPFINHICLVKGDQKAMHVAAASVLAKTHRDQIMAELDHSFPQYHWSKNKGYPTADHLEALEIHGASCHHRLSFGPVANSLSKT